MEMNIMEFNRLPFEMLTFPTYRQLQSHGTKPANASGPKKSSKTRKRHVRVSSDSKILYEYPEGKGMQIIQREHMNKYAFLGLAIFCLHIGCSKLLISFFVHPLN